MNTCYAGFWRRFAAIIIDILVLVIPQIVFSRLVGVAFISRAGYTDPAQIHIGFTIMSSIMGILITWIYYAAFESSRHQATLGKMALGLRVTDCYGRPISYGRASARYFGKLLSSLILGLGYLMAAFTERKQALHDIMRVALLSKRMQIVHRCLSP